MIWLFLVDALHAPIDPIYNAALLREIDKIAAAIPHDELAIQFDVASAVFAGSSATEPPSYGRSKAEMQETFSKSWSTRNRVPADIELLYHLCYGDSTTATWWSRPTWATWSSSQTACRARHRAAHPADPHAGAARPRRRRLFRAAASGSAAAGDRAVPRPRALHRRLEGTKRRLATARKYAAHFSVATECGFGRRDPRTIPELLRIHAQVADLD